MAVHQTVTLPGPPRHEASEFITHNEAIKALWRSIKGEERPNWDHDWPMPSFAPGVEAMLIWKASSTVSDQSKLWCKKKLKIVRLIHSWVACETVYANRCRPGDTEFISRIPVTSYTSMSALDWWASIGSTKPSTIAKDESDPWEIWLYPDDFERIANGWLEKSGFEA